MPRERVNHAPGVVWLHIDRFDKRSQAVWAVQDVGPTGRPRYRVAESVTVDVPCVTRHHSDGIEPKAYLVAIGVVIWDRRHATIREMP